MTTDSGTRLLPKSLMQQLLDVLHQKGYRVMGPVPREGAVVWDTIRRVSDLPVGWRDTQEPGRYRLEQAGTGEIFGVVHGSQSVKPLTFAPTEPLLQIERSREGWTTRPTLPSHEQIAVLGARPCDLAGLAVQDRIFLNDVYRDPYYEARRAGLLLIGVNCTRALSTCFCASMETGPRAQRGFDLLLTELDEAVLFESGSPAGLEVMTDLPLHPASAGAVQDAAARFEACATSQVRRLDRANLPQQLYDAQEHPRWDDVAGRCLACGNCTMVCPTCFCHRVEDSPDLTRQQTTHSRLWDSCFTPDHGYIHGKNVRPTIKDRYRMWLTHKLASWIDQFGTSGCVGCGRCITWCPVGIDLTEELAELAQAQTPKAPA